MLPRCLDSRSGKHGRMKHYLSHEDQHTFFGKNVTATSLDICFIRGPGRAIYWASLDLLAGEDTSCVWFPWRGGGEAWVVGRGAAYEAQFPRDWEQAGKSTLFADQRYTPVCFAKTRPQRNDGELQPNMSHKEQRNLIRHILQVSSHAYGFSEQHQ